MTTGVVLLPVSVVVLGLAGRMAWATSRRAAVGDRLPATPVDAGRGRGGVRLGLPLAPSWLEPALTDAAVDIAPPTAWLVWIGGVVVMTAASAAASGAMGAVLALVVTSALPALGLRSRRGRADRRSESELPSALEAVARSLRSGASVRQAIAEAAGAGAIGGIAVGGGGAPAGDRAGETGRGRGLRAGPARGRSPLQTELATVADQADHGTGLVGALEAMAARRPTPGVRLAVAALCLGIDTGGAQARAIDGVAATLRERLGVEAEVRALSSQARMSALVIGLAPLGFGVFAAATDPRTSDFLLRTPVGLALVGLGLLLDGAGWLWMQRLCRVTT